MEGNEAIAIRNAYDQQIGLMFAVFLDALVQENANVAEACQRFKKGIALLRKAKLMAIDMVSE